MRILFLSTKSPLPMNDGHSIRTFHIMRILSEQHEIRLLSFVKFPEERDHVDELKKYCSRVKLLDAPANRSKAALFRTLVSSSLSGKPFVAHKYDTAEMRREIEGESASGGIDLVHLDLAPLGCYVDMLAGRTVVLNAHNVEASLLKRRVENESRPLHKLFWTLQQRRYEAFERGLAGRVDRILCCSAADRAEFGLLAPNTPAAVVPNAVDTDYFRPLDRVDADPAMLLFVGGMDWFPNRDAIEWFDRAIFDRILKKAPDTRLHVIGRSEGIRGLQHAERIRFEGYVDDIRPLMGRASAVIVPLRIGGGTRLKILNAMAMGKTVVSTSVGAEGLGLGHGSNALLADTPETFADEVCSLVADGGRSRRLGAAARRFIVETYSWGIIGKELHRNYAPSRDSFEQPTPIPIAAKSA